MSRGRRTNLNQPRKAYGLREIPKDRSDKVIKPFDPRSLSDDKREVYEAELAARLKYKINPLEQFRAAAPPLEQFHQVFAPGTYQLELDSKSSSYVAPDATWQIELKIANEKEIKEGLPYWQLEFTDHWQNISSIEESLEILNIELKQPKLGPIRRVLYGKEQSPTLSLNRKYSGRGIISEEKSFYVQEHEFPIVDVIQKVDKTLAKRKEFPQDSKLIYQLEEYVKASSYDLTIEQVMYHLWKAHLVPNEILRSFGWKKELNANSSRTGNRKNPLKK